MQGIDQLPIEMIFNFLSQTSEMLAVLMFVRDVRVMALDAVRPDHAALMKCLVSGKGPNMTRPA